ncbi:MAG: ANTAR domain-containing response regulator [Micrococcales bacterium]
MSEAAKRRVLVVEDEALIRLDTVETLREFGFEIIGEAADGEQAIAMAADLKPDVIVMDVKMPKMDGITAAEKIQDLRIPVVLLTAFSQKELVDRASEAGAMAYVVKPITNPQSQLIPAIEIAIARNLQFVALEEEVKDITERLETRKLVDRAKALLTEKASMNEPEAFRAIQKMSMDQRVTMKDVALVIIEKFTEKKG